MHELIREYRGTLRAVNKARFGAVGDDRKLLGSAADSVRFAITYMERGQHPENRRAVTRLSGEQREVPFDPMNAFFVKQAALQRRTKSELTLAQQDLLDDLLAILTPREREAFMMVRGGGYSFAQAAQLSGVTKGTTQNLVARAEKKLHFVVRKPPKGRGIILSQPLQRVMF